MFLKILVGFIFTIVGGGLIGIGLMSEYVMPLWWWIMALLFICVGIMGIFFSYEKDRSNNVDNSNN